VECQHRSLGNAIKALTEGDQPAWEDNLPHALFAMCTSICVSTGVAPFAAMFGRNVSTSLEMVFGAPPTALDDVADMYEYTTNLRSRMAKEHAYIRKNMRSQRQAYYKDRRTYQPTGPVWLWTPAPTQAGPAQEVCTVLNWTVADQTSVERADV
jgi:hypothetical protein